MLLYAEGKWDAHLVLVILEEFAKLPAGSVIFHIDRSDAAEAHRILGGKFCLSGGVPNTLMAFGTPEEVKAHCRMLIEKLGEDGGYIMDTSAIMQNDVSIENLKAMTDAAREYGVYRSASAVSSKATEPPGPAAKPGLPDWITAQKIAPGVCFPFEQKALELPSICGDPALVRRVWNDIEGLAYLYIWHVLLSF